MLLVENVFMMSWRFELIGLLKFQQFHFFACFLVNSVVLSIAL